MSSSSSSSSHNFNNNNNIDVTSTDSIYFFSQQNKVSDILNLSKLSYLNHLTNNNNSNNNNNNDNDDHINNKNISSQSMVVDDNTNNIIDERRSSRRLALRSINESSSQIHKYRDDDNDHNEDDLDSDSDDDDDDDVLVEEKVVVEDTYDDDDNNDKNGYVDHDEDVVTTLSRNALKNSRPPPPPHPKKKRGWHSTRIGAIDIVAALSTNTTNDTDEVLILKNIRGSKSSSSSSSAVAATPAVAAATVDFDTSGDHDVFNAAKRSRGRPRKIITPVDDDLFREIVTKYTHIDSSTDWAKVMMELPVGHDLNIGKCRNRWRKMNSTHDDSTVVEMEAIKSGHDRYDPMIEKAFMKQSRKKDPDELRCRTKWTLEMDAHLSEAVVLHGPKWKKAAELVGNNVNNLDCHRRWQHYLKPMKEGYKNQDWTVDEYYELKDLVLNHTSMGRKTPDKVTIDWSFISKKMNRKYNACRHTWHHICNQSLKQGRFTKEEDDIICKKAKDALNSTSTGTLPHGFWVAIGEELNRIPDSITLRWNRYLSTL